SGWSATSWPPSSSSSAVRAWSAPSPPWSCWTRVTSWPGWRWPPGWSPPSARGGGTEWVYRWLDRAAAQERPGWRGWWAVALRPGHGSSRRQVVGATVLHAVSIAGLLVVGSLPAWAAANLGVIACF